MICTNVLHENTRRGFQALALSPITKGSEKNSQKEHIRYCITEGIQKQTYTNDYKRNFYKRIPKGFLQKEYKRSYERHATGNFQKCYRRRIYDKDLYLELYYDKEI